MKLLVVIVLYTILALPVSAQEFNAGIVQGLWYSQDIFADQPVRIYVAIRNNTGTDMTGTVEFFDNDTRIARKSVSALNGRIIESWADWTPSYGEHTIKATLSRTKLQAVGETAETISVTSSLAEDAFFADYDTDGDGVGNKKDIDDDGDGISDEVEIQNGTDPLVFNEPPKEETKIDTTSTTTVNRSSGGGDNDGSARGLEQYLTPSRAETMLAGITDTINSTKEKLDTYRESRTVANGTAEPAPAEEIEVNKDGFGEITRTSKEETKKQNPKETKQKDQSEQKPQNLNGFFGDLFTFARTIIGGIYTGILATISFALGYPILMQLLLLFGILFLLYKIAKRLGGRP